MSFGSILGGLFTDPAQRISRDELNRFSDLRASGNPDAPSAFDAEAIVSMHAIKDQSFDSTCSQVADATVGIYDKLSALPNSTIPMAALLRAAFTVLAPGLPDSCTPAIAAAKVGATALLEQDIPFSQDPDEADQFRDYIGLGAVHAVSDLAARSGDFATQNAAQAALGQYSADAAVSGGAHNAAINLVNFLSSQAERA